jgi:phenylalanyl-tRNA synthetase alpha chain
MIDQINDISKFLDEIRISSISELEEFRLKYLSKKGEISRLFDSFRSLPPEQKKIVGKPLNELKNKAKQIYSLQEKSLSSTATSTDAIDFSMPSEPFLLGSHHPITIIRNRIVQIFTNIGFNIYEGPEIEDDWHNFSGLNFPEEHPARDMQDTFFINVNPDILLRTHTSSVQVRSMEHLKPPIREIFPGRVFRNEAISARSHCIFHQVEGLYIDTNVSFADLKQTLLYFAKEMFGDDTEIRLRPSFFPFTEPSAEMDISCTICKGKGCNVCKYTGFVEILGCGMVDPNVLEASNIDSKKYTGFAFGMGIERTAMLKYQVNDIRLYFENDTRFLDQFRSNSLK